MPLAYHAFSAKFRIAVVERDIRSELLPMIRAGKILKIELHAPLWEDNNDTGKLITMQSERTRCAGDER
jgi:hypothetical protein